MHPARPVPHPAPRFDPALLDDLIHAGERFAIAEGDVLFREGTPADHAYCVTAGRLEVSARIPGDEWTVVGEIAEGEIVGEFALLHERPRSTRVRAVRPSEGVRIVRDRFAARFADGWRPAIRLLDGLCRLNAARIRAGIARIGDGGSIEPSAWRTAGTGPAPQPRGEGAFTAGFTGLPLLAGLARDVDALGAMGQWLSVARGGVIAAEGDPADRVWMVVRGAVRGGLARAGRIAQLAVYGPGETVGMTAMIDGAAQPLALEAAEAAVLLSLGADRFGALRECTAPLGRAMLAEAGRQLVRDQQRVNRQLSRMAMLERLETAREG